MMFRNDILIAQEIDDDLYRHIIRPVYLLLSVAWKLIIRLALLDNVYISTVNALIGRCKCIFINATKW